MFEIIFAFFPMLSGYIFGGIGLDLIVMALTGIAVLRKQRFRIIFDKRNRVFILLFVYVAIKDILIVFLGQSDSSESFHRFLSNIAYMVFFLIVVRKDFNQNKFYRGLVIAGTVYTLGLLYHLVMIYIFKQPVMGISLIPGYHFSNTNYLNRPRSFFSEPAALAQAMLPLLFYSLHRKDYIWSIIATFTIFMSTSTTGVLLAGVLWLIEFVFITERKAYKIVVVLAFLLMSALLISTELATASLSSVRDALTGGGSTNMRVFLGFEIIKTMQPKEYIIGVFFNKAYDYVSANLSLFAPETIARRVYSLGESMYYMNTISGLVFRYGIIGLILYFRVLKGKIFNKNYQGRTLAIMILIEMIGASLLFNSSYFYIMLVLSYFEQQKEQIDESIAY